jgi:hypothetical protein
LPTTPTYARYILALPRSTAFEFMADTDGLVAAETLAHIDHAAFALAEAAPELLALCRQGIEEWGREAFEGRVARDEDALGILEALR